MICELIQMENIKYCIISPVESNTINNKKNHRKRDQIYGQQ